MHSKVYKSLELRRKKVRLRGEELTHKSLKEFWSAVSRKAQSTLKFSLHLTRASCFQSRSQIRLHRVKNLKYIGFITPSKPQTRIQFQRVADSCKVYPRSSSDNCSFHTINEFQFQLSSLFCAPWTQIITNYYSETL